MTDSTQNAAAPRRDMTPLQSKLQQAEARVWRRNLLSLLAWLVGGAALAFFGYFLLDYLTHFPAAVRLLMTAALLGVFAVWLPRRHRHHWARETDINRLARKVEREVSKRRSGGFGSLLVSGLEFGTRPEIGGSDVLKDRTVQQSLGGDCDPLSVDLHDHRLQRRGLQLIAAAAAVYVLWILVSATTLGIFAQRAVGVSASYPTSTIITSVDYPPVMKLGDDLTVTVSARGELPGGGVLRVNYTGESSFDVALTPDETGSVYTATIAKPAESLEFRVRLGDARGEAHGVQVLPPPVASSGVLLVTAPAYTKIGVREYPLSNVNVAAGSTLAVRITPDRPVTTAELVAGDARLPLTQDADGSYSAAPITVTEPTTYSIRLVDAKGIENTDRIAYRIGVIADREPAIRLARPESESYWAPVSRIKWEARLSDDYGLQAARLRLQIATRLEDGTDDVKSTEFRALTLPGTGQEATLADVLQLDSTGAVPGQQLLLSLQVRDAGPASEAAMDEAELWHSSETLRLYVVTAAELREIILAEEQLAYKQIDNVADDVKHQIRMLEMQEQLNGDPE